MRSLRKVLALLLSLCMLLTSMPLSSYAEVAYVRASELSENKLVDAAIFCSDVHDSTSDVSSVFSGIKSSGLNYSTATFAGDTFNGSSKKETVTSVVRTALGSNDIECFYSYGTHDSRSDIENKTELVYSGEYYIFVISQTDMASSSPDTTVFTDAVAKMDHTKPLFIASHVPLHERRNDNNGAAKWYEAISAAAEEMDITFFWAHNHTEETSADIAAYYVRRDGEEKLSIQGGSEVIPNFTYMNAGYINANNQSPKRKGIATTVQIYDDCMVFQDYNSSGEYTGNYSHNVSVEREFAKAEDEIPEDAELADIEIVNNGKTYYFKDDELDLEGLEVKALYTLDGETYYKELSLDAVSGYTVDEPGLSEPGQKEVKVNYNTKSKSFFIYVCERTTSEAGVSVSFDAACITSLEVKSVDIENNLSGFLCGDYEAYDITATYAGDYDSLQGKATVTLPIPDGVTNPAVCYVSDEGDIEPMTITSYGNGVVSFETTHFSVYAIGEADEDASHSEILGGKTSVTSTKTVYVLASSIESDKSYLIASSNSAGSTVLLKNNNGSVGTTNATINNGNTSTGNKVYIELESADNELWTVGTYSSDWYTFKNNGKYLYHTRNNNKSGGGNTLSLSDSSAAWYYSSNRIYYSSKWSSYYLRYNNSWGLSNSSANVYFYVPTEITTTTEVNTEVTYSVSADDIVHIYDENSEDKVELITSDILANNVADDTLGGTYAYKVVSDTNGIIEKIENSAISFTAKAGTAYVRVYYTFTKDGNEYKIWNTIEVKASYPYYTVDITKASVNEDNKGSGESITDIVAIKKVEKNDAYELWADVYKNGEELVVVESKKLTWKSNNSAIANVDEKGTVTFTGEEGTVQITVYYEYTDNEGNKVQATDVVTFSVSKESYIFPSDGTNDFPEYPNQGSVRFDKTATAVGSFSQTGIAKMELSMTGVPYTSGKAMDVLLMLDMTTSMDTEVATGTDRVDVTISATKAFAKNIVQNDDGSYNSNKIAIKYFNDNEVHSTTDYISVSSDTELESLYKKIEALYTPKNSGTKYSVALEDAYETITAQGTKSENTQSLVFMSDGGPTYYTYLDTSGTAITTGDSGGSFVGKWFNYTSTPYSATDEFKTEYYTYKLKNEGCSVYTVGLGLSTTNSGSGPSFYRNLSSAQQEFITSYILEQMATDSNYFYNIADTDAVADMSNIFSGIATSIREAATNVVVEDMISDEYKMNFKLPNDGVTSEDVGIDEFYIQAVEYVLDTETHERTDTLNVLENFTFNKDGSLKSHTVDGAACENCTHVTIKNGEVTAINGTYFRYYIDSDGNEMLEWKADKLTGNELALQYFLYLENSAGLGQNEINDGEAIDAGTYPTNKYATLTYTNHLGNECQQEFPVPSLTWSGAQVTYVFYLVNEDGLPVNRAGKIVPFAEAVYVTDPITYDVTWNETTGAENMLAEKLFASENVPDVYQLYDKDAYYEIRVYQTEGVDQANYIKNYNYFKIAGSSDVTSKTTTKVFNTKAGTKFDKYGVYSAQDVGSKLYTVDEDDKPSSVEVTYQTNDIDYANTTVAFAVVWKPSLVEDVVVVDYGLDVVIDVIANDAMAAGVTGLMLNAPDNIKINEGTYANAITTNSVQDSDGIYQASVENLNAVRFHQNKTGMHEPMSFYYNAGVNYYSYENDNAKLNTTNMYSKVTVIPATMVYYEDEFVTLTHSEKQEDGSYKTLKGWDTSSVEATAAQDVDRPGISQSMNDLYDANNLYGYDSAYENMSEFSMGNAAKVNVCSGKYANAEFDFFGTGFDIISMTDTTTGYILVSVYDTAGKKVAYSSVDTYYGYARTEHTDGNGNTTYTWETVDSNSPNALYQVPVIKMSGLEYGEYKVVLTVSYVSFFDHTDEEGYDFYLDAIRIYDPCGYENETANAAYAKDNEAYPKYSELRNMIIDSNTFNALNSDESISGCVFLDAANINGAGETDNIADYTNIGPNNELYLSAGQSIAFKLDATAFSGEVSSVHLAAKTVGGLGKFTIYAVDENNKKTEISNELNTATDMYFDITELNNKTVVIKNVGEASNAIISLTNIKVTYTQKQSAESEAVLMLASQADISRAMRIINQDDEKFETNGTESDNEDSGDDIKELENNSLINSWKTWKETVTNGVKNAMYKINNLFNQWFGRR